MSEAVVRTCIGCRTRSSTDELIRVVADPSATGRKAAEQVVATSPVVVDTRRVLPGRGAWLHATRECFELAEKRRAFMRALRVKAVDVEAVRAFIANSGGNITTTSGGKNLAGAIDQESGLEADGHPMSTQR